MGFLTGLWLQFCPVITAFAADANSGGGSFIGKVVKWAGGIGGGLVAIALIISLVKDALEMSKGGGNASPIKIIGKALLLILVLGLIGLAMNYDSLTNKGKTVGNIIVNEAENQAKEATGGGTANP